MADISILSRLIGSLNRNVDLSSNTLVMSSLKLGTSELTKAKLDLLAITTDSNSAVDASAQHHHDGRYFTESELGSTANGASGSSLIGVDQTPAFSNISGANLQALMESIDSALDSAGGDEFVDNVFRINGSSDASSQLAFEVDAIATSTTRTITMPDANVDLGEIATNTTHSSGDGSDHQDVADLASLSGVAANSTNLGSFSGDTIADSQTMKQAFQALETKTENNTSIINNFEWQISVLDFVTDNTAVPASENSGDRYVLSDAGGSPNAAWDGASAGDIVDFDGSSWIAVTPTIGTFVAADDEANVLYLWGGSSWSAKNFEATTASAGLTKSGFDIRLADASANSGIVVSSGAISLSLASNPGLEFASNLLRVLLDNTGGSNLASVVDRNSNGISLRVDDSSIEDDGNGATARLRVKASGITNTMLAGSIATSKLSDSSEISEAVTFFGNTDISASEAETLTDGSNADSLHEHAVIKESMTAGESFAANTSFVVRRALSGETAGRIYKADKGAGAAGGETNKIYSIGIAHNPTGSAITAGNPIEVIRIGTLVLESADSDFTAAQDEGLPVYLTAAGAFSLTAPSSTNDAQVLIGTVANVGASSAIDVKSAQIMGIV